MVCDEVIPSDVKNRSENKLDGSEELYNDCGDDTGSRFYYYIYH